MGTIWSGSLRDRVSPSSFAFSSKTELQKWIQNGEKNNVTGNGVERIEGLGVDEVVGEVDDEGENPQKKEVDRHRVRPVAAWIVEYAERMPYRIRNKGPCDIRDCRKRIRSKEKRRRRREGRT